MTATETLSKKYNSIYETKEWDYYEHSGLTNPFLDLSNVPSFSEQYFKRGKKESIFKDLPPIDDKRAIHSVSVFFLGFLLKPLFNITFICEKDFCYLWFLICLFHDYGYEIEKDKSNRQDFSNFLKKHNIYPHKNLLAPKNKTVFGKETIKNYFKYCYEKRNKTDHGIAAGMLLYDRLKKNYDVNKKKAKKEGIDVDCTKEFDYKNLRWLKDDSDYIRVADVVLSHNIWFAPVDKHELYKSYGLNELIPNDETKNKISKDPLFVLFAICDTIDPIKFFTQHKPECILEKTNIDIDKDAKEIIITVLDKCISCEEWFKKIKDLETWLPVTVEKSDKILKIKRENK